MLLGCLCVSTLATAATTPDFYTVPAYPVGGTFGASASVSIASGDFNNDGITDVVTAYNDTILAGTVSILTGLKNGTFKPAVSYAIKGKAVAVAVGDFNNDGKQDIVVLSGDATGGIDLLLGNGDGTFQVAKPLTIPGGSRAGLVVADFNGDGNLDLAYGNGVGNNVSVALGNGNGTFQAPVAYSAGHGPLSLALGDVNNDGKPDLVAGTVKGVVVFLGNGDGTFKPALTTSVGGEYVSLADLNQDGNLDVLGTLAGGTALIVAFGNGDGTFQTPTTYEPAGGCCSPQTVAVLDLNGDGKPDVVLTGNPDNSVAVLLNNGNGTLKPPVKYYVSADPSSLIGGKFGSTQAVGLAITNLYGVSVNITLSNTNGTLIAPPIQAGPGGGASYAAVGDINGDGKLDVVQSVGGELGILLGNGNFTFQPPTTISTNGMGAGPIAIGDLTGNKKNDLVVVGGPSYPSLEVFLNNGNGTFAAPVSYALSSDYSYGVALGDFNGDGKLDIALTGFNNNTFQILLNNGNGTFKPAITTSVTGPGTFAVADFNGDGKLDVAIETYESSTDQSQITVLFGKGDGTFSAPVNYLTATGEYASVLAADFNGDGKPDLVVSIVALGSTLEQEVASLLNNGNGTFGSPTYTQVGGDPTVIAVGDFTGNGNQDIAVAASGVSILNGNGNGTFQPYSQIITCSTQALFAASVNVGGKPDLIDVCSAGGQYGYSNVIVLPNQQGPH
jgi:hypothetical protein